MKEIKIVATEFYYKCPCWLTEDVSIQLVKVTGLCTAAEVDALLYGLLGFNDISLSVKPAESLIALMQEMKENNVAMSGGLLFQEDEKVITPSCCCGLEQWKEIVNDIKAKKDLGWDMILGEHVYMKRIKPLSAQMIFPYSKKKIRIR